MYEAASKSHSATPPRPARTSRRKPMTTTGMNTKMNPVELKSMPLGYAFLAIGPSRRGRRAWLVDEHPVPDLEHEEAPQLLVVIGATGGMVVDVAADDVRAEVATLTSARVEKHVAGQRAKVLAKPVIDRRAESHLGPAQDRRWQHAIHGALEQIFRRQPAQLQRRRQPRGELHDLVVEERRAHL